VVAADVGGAFGIKAQVYPEEILLAWIARRIGKTVKWTEARSEHFQAASHARDQRIRFSAAVRNDGRVLGLRATVLSNIGAYGVRPFGPLLDPMTCAGLIPGPYDIRDYEYESYAIATNKCPEGPYRGVGMVTAVLAHERLMDLIAARLALDPAGVRRVNFVTRAQMPYVAATGHPYESGDYGAALDAALAAFGYADLRQEQARAKGEGRLLHRDRLLRGVHRRGVVDIRGAWMRTSRHRHAHIYSAMTAAFTSHDLPAIGQGVHTTSRRWRRRAWGGAGTTQPSSPTHTRSASAVARTSAAGS
jgi:CO/xanthine dehydrogenase Mo-binding subunit